jgi:hypothetical protein
MGGVHGNQDYSNIILISNTDVRIAGPELANFPPDLLSLSKTMMTNSRFTAGPGHSMANMMRRMQELMCVRSHDCMTDYYGNRFDGRTQKGLLGAVQIDARDPTRVLSLASGTWS